MHRFCRVAGAAAALTVAGSSSALAYFTEDSTGKVDRVSHWDTVWASGVIGFHKKELNTHLRKAYQQDVYESKRVLVPLCGKSVDLTFLAGRGHEVVGVECASKALDDFDDENSDFLVEDTLARSSGSHSSPFVTRKWVNKRSIEAEEGDAGSGASGSVTMLQGDIFDLSVESTGGAVDLIWDRASLVALPPHSHSEYASTLSSLLTAGREGHCRILLSVVEYPQHQNKGPPFSVSSDDVHRLYPQSKGFEVSELSRENVLHNGQHERFIKRGVTKFEEVLYRVKRREPLTGTPVCHD